MGISRHHDGTNKKTRVCGSGNWLDWINWIYAVLEEEAAVDAHGLHRSGGVRVIKNPPGRVSLSLAVSGYGLTARTPAAAAPPASAHRPR